MLMRTVTLYIGCFLVCLEFAMSRRHPSTQAKQSSTSFLITVLLVHEDAHMPVHMWLCLQSQRAMCRAFQTSGCMSCNLTRAGMKRSV